MGQYMRDCKYPKYWEHERRTTDTCPHATAISVRWESKQNAYKYAASGSESAVH